jgi:hypothetical protein
MGDDIEIHFRGGVPKEWHSGTFSIDGDLITVTATDGRLHSLTKDVRFMPIADMRRR